MHIDVVHDKILRVCFLVFVRHRIKQRRCRSTASDVADDKKCQCSEGHVMFNSDIGGVSSESQTNWTLVASVRVRSQNIST